MAFRLRNLQRFRLIERTTQFFVCIEMTLPEITFVFKISWFRRLKLFESLIPCAGGVESHISSTMFLMGMYIVLAYRAPVPPSSIRNFSSPSFRNEWSFSSLQSWWCNCLSAVSSQWIRWHVTSSIRFVSIVCLKAQKRRLTVLQQSFSYYHSISRC